MTLQMVHWSDIEMILWEPIDKINRNGKQTDQPIGRLIESN